MVFYRNFVGLNMNNLRNSIFFMIAMLSLKGDYSTYLKAGTVPLSLAVAYSVYKYYESLRSDTKLFLEDAAKTFKLLNSIILEFKKKGSINEHYARSLSFVRRSNLNNISKKFLNSVSSRIFKYFSRNRLDLLRKSFKDISYQDLAEIKLYEYIDSLDQDVSEQEVETLILFVYSMIKKLNGVVDFDQFDSKISREMESSNLSGDSKYFIEQLISDLRRFSDFYSDSYIDSTIDTFYDSTDFLQEFINPALQDLSIEILPENLESLIKSNTPVLKHIYDPIVNIYDDKTFKKIPRDNFSKEDKNGLGQDSYRDWL